MTPNKEEANREAAIKFLVATQKEPQAYSGNDRWLYGTVMRRAAELMEEASKQEKIEVWQPKQKSES